MRIVPRRRGKRKATTAEHWLAKAAGSAKPGQKLEPRVEIPDGAEIVLFEDHCLFVSAIADFLTSISPS